MLKSCSYCGKIHDSKYGCGKKPKKEYKITDTDKFRWSKPWQRKREQINKRDNYMCQVCIRKLHNTQYQYNYEDIEVHHIEPLTEQWDLRLEDSNLICLCTYHHKLAGRGHITKKELKAIVKEQESK